MIDRDWLGKIIALVIVAAMPFILARAASAELWPIKTFEVVPVPVAPSETADFRAFLESLPPELTAEDKERLIDQVSAANQPMLFAEDLIPQIEAALTKAAHFFEQNGFPPPALTPVVDKDGVPAYRVFLVKDLVNSGAYRPNPCDERTIDKQIILLNYEWMGPVEELTLDTKQIAAHELFHAVQYNTPFYQSCDSRIIGDWITEGTATAMGWAATQDEWPVGAYTFGWDEIWGLRDYEIPLTRPYDPSPIRDPVAYATNSFWTYLGEHNAMSGSPATPGLNPIDMSYLAQFLNAEPVTRDCASPGARCMAEIKWLDQQVGAPLRDLFARFAQAYALYGRWRIEGAALYDELWLDKAFATFGCREVALRPVGENLQQVIDLEPFAPWTMRCWQVRPMGFEGDTIPVAVTVEMPSGAQSPSLLQLTSVIADGSRRLEKAKLDSHPGDRQRVRWEYDFTITAEDPDTQGTLFLLTNVADAADLTEPFVGINNTGLRVTFTALPEYVSMGPTNFDSGALTDEINEPLEIELDNYQAVVQPGLYEAVGENYMGVRHSEGIVNPCVLLVTGYTDRQPDVHFNNMLGITLQVSGPIRPGEYVVAPFSENSGDPSEILPPGQAVAGVVLTNMPEGTNDLQFETGLLLIKHISPDLVFGHISGIANNRALSSLTGNYEIVETRSLAAKFSIRVRGAYRDGDYPCIDSSKPD